MPFRSGSGDTAFPDAQTFDKQYTAAKKFTEEYVRGIVAAASPTEKLTQAIAALTKSISAVAAAWKVSRRRSRRPRASSRNCPLGRHRRDDKPGRCVEVVRPGRP